MDEAELEVALVKVFIMINPGMMKSVYGIPSMVEIRRSKVKPKMSM
jgi:hypothetical protein